MQKNRINTKADIVKFENRLTSVLLKMTSSLMEVIINDDRADENPEEIAQEMENRKEVDIARFGFDPSDKKVVLERYRQGKANQFSFPLDPLIFPQGGKSLPSVPYLKVSVSAHRSDDNEFEHFLIDKTRSQ